MFDRRYAILLSLTLSACSSAGAQLEPVYSPPTSPTEKAVAVGVGLVAKDAKLVKPLQVSAVRQNDHGPGSYFVCLREVSPPPDRPRRIYAVFFDSDSYRGARLSVIMDQCELQTYGPAPEVAVPLPPPSAPPAKQSHRKHRAPDPGQ